MTILRMDGERMEKARKAALATVHVNHPGAAYRLMRELAEYTLDLRDDLREAREMLEEEQARSSKCGEFLRATTATLVSERRAR